MRDKARHLQSHFPSRLDRHGLRRRASASEDAESLEQTIRLDGLRILIVDDEPEMQDLLTTLLTQYGAQVTARASGAEALDAIDELQPSLLISDIGMPDEDGYSLMRKIRRRGEHFPPSP